MVFSRKDEKLSKRTIRDGFGLCLLSLFVSLLALDISLSFATPLPASAKEKPVAGVPHPFFWEIKGPKGQVAHLMGTMHIPDERWARLPAELLSRDRADAVYGELNLTDKT